MPPPLKESEHFERLKLVKALLQTGYSKGEIKKILAKQYGMGYRACEPYISRARRWLLSDSQQSVEDIVAKAFGFYLSALRSPDADWREKILAQEKILELTGSKPPQVIHHHLRHEITERAREIISRLCSDPEATRWFLDRLPSLKLEMPETAKQ